MAGIGTVVSPALTIGVKPRADSRVILGAAIAQLPALELIAYLEAQAESNPVLETVEDADDGDLGDFIAGHLPPVIRERPRSYGTSASVFRFRRSWSAMAADAAGWRSVS